MSLPFNNLVLTSGSGVTPNFLYRKSPKLWRKGKKKDEPTTKRKYHLVLCKAPIQRDSPKESVITEEPIILLRRLLSTRASA